MEELAMNRKSRIPTIAAATLLAVAGAALAGNAFAEDAPQSWDGLVEITPKRMDAVFLLPGADFRGYKRIMLDPTQVAFHKDWARNVGETGGSRINQISKRDIEEILAAARSNFDDVFHTAFTEAGYEIATAPAPDVLRVSTAVLNLYINAPEAALATGARTRMYTANAGEATLVVETRDSETGALLGRVIDRRETREAAGPQLATRATNEHDFRRLFEGWAKIVTDGIGELKAHSPVPEDLQPKQKL
jgi:hypothetical protein